MVRGSNLLGRERTWKPRRLRLRRYLDAEPVKMTTYRSESEHEYPDAVATTPPPSPITELVGDCLGALRCPLDYIAWELATMHFAPPFRSEEEERTISFPIYRERGHKRLTSKLTFFETRGIPTEAIKEIQAVQPYQQGYGALWLLNRLVNADKHRTPSLTVGTAGTITWLEMGGRCFSPPHRARDGWQGEQHHPHLCRVRGAWIAGRALTHHAREDHR